MFTSYSGPCCRTGPGGVERRRDGGTRRRASGGHRRDHDEGGGQAATQAATATRCLLRTGSIGGRAPAHLAVAVPVNVTRAGAGYGPDARAPAGGQLLVGGRPRPRCGRSHGPTGSAVPPTRRSSTRPVLTDPGPARR